MGILRVDKLSGLETPTPVTGSVLFDGNDHLDIDISNGEFAYGTGDFTWELWFNADSTFLAGSGGYLIDHAPADTDGNDGSIWAGSDELFYHSAGVSGPSNLSFGDIEGGVWYHAAVSRKSGTTKLFLNGLEVNSATDNADFTTSLTRLRIADYIGSGYNYTGYISNLRIVKGTALYTSNFTPKHELEAIGDTVLLCCNNPDSVTAASYAGTGTSRIITTSGDPSVGTASTEFPGLTKDFTFGTEFRGVTTFDTQGYFVPPSGTTTKRFPDFGAVDAASARGVIGGGNNPSNIATIEFFTISTTGNAQDFGDLTDARGSLTALASKTRGIFACGYSPGDVNTIDYVTISSTGNALDFGDNNASGNNGARYAPSGVSNSTRGLIGGGQSVPGGTQYKDITYITIATTGNAFRFGDLNTGGADGGSCANSTRGVFAGGQPGHNVIDFVAINTLGNAVDFGDLNGSSKRGCHGGGASATRGIFGGFKTPTQLDEIDYITIQSLGNAQDFGNLTDTLTHGAACSSVTRCVWSGGYVGGSKSNTIQYVTISTLGNALNFGDLTDDPHYHGACSNGHGGLG